jgi:archaemetzincin
MKILTLVPVGPLDRGLLETLSEGLAAQLRVACAIQPASLNPEFAYNPLRAQYHSSEILKRLLADASAECWKILGVTDADLYIPILTFVFGEAQLSDHAAVVSSHRLRQEFYGLPADPALLRERLLKEALHELGHTFGLRHCRDYRCVMSPSHTVETIDLKSAEFCNPCASAVLV